MLTIRDTPAGRQLGVWAPSRRRPGRRDFHPTLGRGELLGPEGELLWQGEWVENTLHDEGELNLLNVWLREQAHLAKYLMLLGQGNTNALAETTVMTGVTEVSAPGSNGYDRQQIAAADWGAPVLDAGDYQVTAAQKTFGPNTGATWNVSHTALVTVATGTAGLLLISVPLPSVQAVANGISFRHTLTTKAQ